MCDEYKTNSNYYNEDDSSIEYDSRDQCKSVLKWVCSMGHIRDATLDNSKYKCDKCPVNACSPIYWKCEDNHEWLATWESIVNIDSICDKCDV